MQKVSGNKKTRVLTHKQEHITNSRLQAPLQQTLHLHPQKGLCAAHAGTLTAVIWGCRCHQRQGDCVDDGQMSKGSLSDSGVCETCSQGRWMGAVQGGVRDTGHCMPLQRIRSPSNLRLTNYSAKCCKILWDAQKYVKEPPPLFPTLLSSEGRKLHLLKWCGGISSDRGFLKNFLLFLSN